MVKELHIENYFVKRIKEVGGETWKLELPGRRNLPDRLVLLPPRNDEPGGLILLAELKRPGGKPRPAQHVKFSGLLKRFKIHVSVIDTKDAVDQFIKEYT